METSGTGESQDFEGKFRNLKIKRVQFPFDLDMVGFCTPDLQKKLAPAKDRLKQLCDEKEKKVSIIVNRFLRRNTH